MTHYTRQSATMGEGGVHPENCGIHPVIEMSEWFIGFIKQMILERREVHLACIQNQSLTAAFLAGIFESLWPA
jgi:hypothetical protein